MDWLTFHTLSMFATALVLGGMVFFAFFMTPLVFAKLERPIAAGFLRAVFPVYYQVMAVLSVLAALPIWYRAEAVVLSGIAVIFIFVKVLLLPPINRARDARDLYADGTGGDAGGDAGGEARFKRLHRLSVLINLTQMIAVAAVFFRLAT